METVKLFRLHPLPFSREAGNHSVGIHMKHSIGHKQCMKCGAVFQTDLRGGAKWCFPCKHIVYREYQREYKRRSSKSQQERNYAFS